MHYLYIAEIYGQATLKIADFPKEQQQDLLQTTELFMYP